MKMKYIAILTAIITPLLFINCSPSFNALDMSSTVGGSDAYSIRLDESLMTASQTYLSMSELTGIAPNTAIINEYENTSKTSLSESQAVASISSPILMTSANLGSRFCEVLVQNEKALAADQRRFFGALDFTKGVASISDTALETTVGKISSIMWGRSLSEMETDAFKEFKTGFYDAIDANQKNNAGQTDRFALSLCTAGLTSYEALSL